MQTKVLLFDFDGTLVDSREVAVRIYNQIAKENNYPLISKENFAELRNRSARENMRHFGIPFFKLPFLVRRVRTIFKSELSNLQEIPGIRESLQLLKKAGCRLYIISTNSRENIQAFLQHNNIQDFEDIYAVSNIFGKHMKIKRLIQMNKWNNDFVAYIGDEVRDVEAAKKANIRSIAVTWGYNSKEALKKSNPDLVIQSPSELSSLLEIY